MTDRWLYPWALGSVAFGGASLLVPLYIVQLGASPVQLGLLASTAAIVGAPGSILFGRLADRVDNRRPLVGLTLAIVAISLVAIPFSSDITTIIVANAALWLVVASVAPVVTMIVVDATPESVWTERIGRLNAFQGYGWAGGLVLGTVWPIVTGQFLSTGTALRALFWLFSVTAAVSAAGTLRTLPTPDRHVTRRPQIRRIARIATASRRGIRGATTAFSPNRLYWSTRTFRLDRLRGSVDPALVMYLVATALFLTGSAAFWAPLPLLLSESAFGSAEIFALYLVASLGSAVLYEPAGRLASRYDIRRLQAGALTARAVFLPAIVLATGIGSFLFGIGLVGIGMAVIGGTWGFMAVLGATIVTRLAPPQIRGEILGIHAALGAVAGSIGGLLGGWIATFGYLAAFTVAGGLVLAGAVLVLSLRSLSHDTAK
ncbi:MFS transporter [Halorhabdus amylolytica]|uniref:MFS transporter n=1 Tax=Halorhabdus amylolytica TaxID=2559573 RepID=UPI0010AAF5AD|nr:MFS transporter [Halorhabdus amylolytica]